jgi:hypothetical protein
VADSAANLLVRPDAPGTGKPPRREHLSRRAVVIAAVFALVWVALLLAPTVWKAVEGHGIPVPIAATGLGALLVMALAAGFLSGHYRNRQWTGSPSRLVRCWKTAPKNPVPGSLLAPACPRRTAHAVCSR